MKVPATRLHRPAGTFHWFNSFFLAYVKQIVRSENLADINLNWGHNLFRVVVGKGGDVRTQNS